MELPPVYVINLARSADRRARISAELTGLGVEFEVFEAADGSQLSDEEMALYSSPLSRKKNGRELSVGEIGCALSHLRLYQKLLDSSEEAFLILEDDAEFGIAGVEILRRRDQFSSDWELVNFCTDARTKPFGDRVWDIYRLAHFSGLANGTVAYLINRAGAKKLLSHGFPIACAADGLTGRTHMTGLVSYGVFPPVATYERNVSTIYRPTYSTGQRVRKAIKRRLRKLVDKI